MLRFLEGDSSFCPHGPSFYYRIASCAFVRSTNIGKEWVLALITAISECSIERLAKHAGVGSRKKIKIVSFYRVVDVILSVRFFTCSCDVCKKADDSHISPNLEFVNL